MALCEVRDATWHICGAANDPKSFRAGKLRVPVRSVWFVGWLVGVLQNIFHLKFPLVVFSEWHSGFLRVMQTRDSLLANISSWNC